MNLKRSLFIFITAITLAANAQLPVNLVPNHDFEIGTTHADPSKQCFVLDGKINDWNFADPRPGFQVRESYTVEDGVTYPFDECNGAGWTNQDLTANKYRWQVNYSDAPNYANNYIFVEYGGGGKGIRALLNSPIVASESKRYFVRAKVFFDQAINSEYVAFHFTKYGEHWNDNNWRNRRMWDAVKFYPYFNQQEAPYASQTKWNVYETTFLSKWDSRYVDELKNVVIVGGGMGDRSFAVDDIEIFEYCSSNMLRQNRHYYLGREQEEAGTITAGFEDGTNMLRGVVIHQPHERYENGSTLKQYYAPHVIYKAEQAVILKPGFTVERGGEFVARIAPCGAACISSNFTIPTRYSICDNQCIKLNGGDAPLMSYSWTSNNPEFMNYLTNINSSSPTFCPPSSAQSGTYSYTVTITNNCGESTTKTIYIQYDQNSNPTPEFRIIKSNLNESLDNPSLTVEVGEHTELLYFEVWDCNNTLLKRYKYEKGVNMEPSTPVIWKLTDFFTPCGCYRIKVKTKNVCYKDWYMKDFEWTRNRNFSAASLFTTVLCKDGKRWFCFNGTGIAKVNYQIFDRAGIQYVDQTFDYAANPHCVMIPDN
jgi:hypothetical protein